MARVLAISSQTVFGPVGLSASVPALQALGHEVMALPTITLSYHPGHGKPDGQRTPATLMQSMLAGLKRVGTLDNLDAVLTGYFSDAEQVAVIAELLPTLSCKHILVDPVIGDHGALYVPEAVAKAIRDQLLPHATIVTPNIFEAMWLTASSDVNEACARLRIAETIVTSIPRGKANLVTILQTAQRRIEHVVAMQPNMPNGIGDHFSGLYLAARLVNDPEKAFVKAMAQLETVIAQSTGQRSLQFSPPKS
jgi:pyridoxine kinase